MTSDDPSNRIQLDFSIYGEPVELSTRLSLKWFHNNGRQSMPFLNRTLSYMPARYNASAYNFKKSWYELKFEDVLEKRPRRGTGKIRKSPRNGGLVKIIRSQGDTKTSTADQRNCEVRVVVDVESKQEVVEILSADDEEQHHDDASAVSAMTIGVSGDMGKPFPEYNPATNGPPKKNRPANTLFFKSVKKKVRKEVTATLNLSGPFKDAHKLKMQLIVREKMKKMWSSLKPPERRYWERHERWDRKRHRHQQIIFRQWTAQQMGAFYYFLSTSDINRPMSVLETRQDRKCPICLLDARDDRGLINHCSFVHLGLTFESETDALGNLHVRVVPNSDIFEVGMITSDDKNFCFVQSKGKRRIISEEINDLKRTKISTDTCVTKAKKNDSISNEGSLVEDPNGPIRQYYHSSTMEPLEEGDWSIDSDDDEKTDEWRIKLSEQLLEEFEDVSTKEKVFMKLWNRFIRCHTVIADSTIPVKCITFIVEMSKELFENDLRSQFLLHLFNLWDHQLVSSEHILNSLKLYDEIKNRK